MHGIQLTFIATGKTFCQSTQTISEGSVLLLGGGGGGEVTALVQRHFLALVFYK